MPMANFLLVTGNGYDPEGKFFLGEKEVNPADFPEVMKNFSLRTALVNAASLVKENGRYKIAGDPTEGALLSVGLKAGLEKNKLEEEQPLVEEIPFDSER